MIKLLVDSASDIEKNEAEELCIDFIPLKVRFGDVEYSDGINLLHREFFEKLIESAELPQTSQINEYSWEEKFRRLTADGNEGNNAVATDRNDSTKGDITTTMLRMILDYADDVDEAAELVQKYNFNGSTAIYECSFATGKMTSVVR